MQIVRETDKAFILECLTHPKVKPHITPDGMSVDSIGDAPNVMFLCPVDEELGPLGVYVIEIKNPLWVEVHTALLPKAWGVKAAQAAKALIEYLTQAGARKMTTLVPDGNVLALRYAQKAGMKEEGRIAKSYPRDGVLVDQVLLGMELCQQQQS